MKVWASTVVLLAASFLVAAPRMWSADRNAETSAPHWVSTAVPQGTAETGLPPVQGPPEPLALTHRPTVLQQFACGDCHGVASGWLMPPDHEAKPETECGNCHRPAPQPSPIALHGQIDTQENWGQCGLCHSGFAEQRGPAPTSQALCVMCHGEETNEVLPSSHASRSDLVSTCAVCHEQQPVQVPPVPHETEGWQECAFCHGPQRLTPLDGAHTSRASSECLSCHDVMDPPAIADAMHALSPVTEGCASCHAPGRIAPLPETHLERNDATCVLCHQEAHPTLEQ